MSIIENLEKFLEKKPTETNVEYINRLCKAKSDKDLQMNWTQLVACINMELSSSYDESTIRKRWNANNFDNLQIKTPIVKIGADTSEKIDNQLEELRKERDSVYMEKRQLYDQRREYNKLLTSDARADHLSEELVKCAERLNREHPLIFKQNWFSPNAKKEAVLIFTDWHYGMVTDNIWNKYNTDICRQRVKKLVEISKDILLQNKIDVLHVALLGDAAHGAIHVSARVKSEEDTCDQLMHVAEIMAEAINELSSVVNVVNVVSCYGNHLRTIQDKKDSVHSDNMEKIIPWWMKARLAMNSKVTITESEYKEFTRFDVLGYHICAIHGDLEKNFKDIGVTINTLFTKKFNQTIDYTISADKHHTEEFEQFGIDSMLVPSLCGCDDYANDKRLYSRPGQTLMIFNDVYGKEAVYPIPLD